MDGSGIRFGNVTFDVARGRLWAGGRSTGLDRAARAILQMLASEAGNEVGKDRLLEAGWPGRVVHENSLAKAIGRLRHALGADAEALETVHGYGYRLAADVVEERFPRGAAPWWRRALWSPIAIGAVALMVGSATWVTLDSPATRSADEPGLIKGEAADSIGRVLWVDDHPQNNLAERAYLEGKKIAVYQVTTTEEALNLLAMYEYAAVISDMNRNDKPLDGITLVRAMRERRDSTPFILYTVVPSQAQRRLVSEAGGQAATVKPEQLYAVVVPLVRSARMAARSR